MSSTDRPHSQRRTAFVLGGGGRWGAVQVGMLRALVEREISADQVLGTSIGAVNGACFAHQPTLAGVYKLDDFWALMQKSKALRSGITDTVRRFTRQPNAVLDPEPFQRFIGEQLPTQSFSDLTVPFSCVAACIEHSSEQWFTEGPLMPALMASSALPGVFPPYEIDGLHYYDGGLVNSIPLNRAIREGATRIFVLQVGRIEDPLVPPRHLLDTALVSLEISRRHSFATALKHLPDDIEVHILPTGGAIKTNDWRQLKVTDLSETRELTQRAYKASRDYLESKEIA